MTTPLEALFMDPKANTERGPVANQCSLQKLKSLAEAVPYVFRGTKN